MNNLNKIILIIVVAVVLGLLMGVRGEMTSFWQRAMIAGVAGGVFGWLISYLIAKRR